MGESISEYISRLRFQRATMKIAGKNKKLLDVAMEYGYESHSGFIRVFEKIFLHQPKDFRKKLDQKLSLYKELSMEPFEIVQRENVWVVYSRALGDYETSSDEALAKLNFEAKSVYEKMLTKDPSCKLSLTFENAEIISLYYDNPDITEADKIRYEACVSADESIIKLFADYGMQIKILKGCKFARLTYQEESTKEVWLGFYKGVCDDGYTIRDEPPFEKYLNNPATIPLEEIRMEMYIGVE